jgi:hypothetical protein
MHNTRVLVVEDQSVIALDLKGRLAAMGYAVLGPVSTGEDAIRQATELRPTVILMDIILKGEMDGVEAAAHIREHLGIPIIYLTAHSDEQTLKRAQVTEPYGYILKPFEDREVVTAIEMALYKHEAERKLKQTERWLAAILRSIGDAVIATDADGRITFMNPVAETLTGWAQAEAVGQEVMTVFDIFDEDAQAPVPNPIERALASGQNLTLPRNTSLRRGAQYISIEDTVAPIRNDAGQITGGVIVFKDISERKQAEAELQRVNAELQARNAELDAFAHTLAHDLKNSVHVIMGFADMLERDYKDSTDPDLRVAVSAIARTSNKLNDIIKEILLLSVVRNAEVGIGPIDMRHCVAEAQQRVLNLIQQYQAEIRLPVDWPRAAGYAPWIEEVWFNYLSNAVKYGGLPPRIELGSDLQPDGLIRFWVRDNGDGLSPDQQAQLFKPFTQLAKSHGKGHGLGLSIVQRIIEKLGGQVGVESSGRPGEGSAFSFTLPAAPSRPDDRLQPGIASSGWPADVALTPEVLSCNPA